MARRAKPSVLTLQGLVRANHQVELVSAERSPLAQRAEQLGIRCMRHLGSAACLAAQAMARLSARAVTVGGGAIRAGAAQ